jgi:hypothetical protein
MVPGTFLPVMVVIALSLVNLTSISCGTEAGKVPRRLVSKGGKGVLELRGDVWGYPSSAWFVSPSTGKETQLQTGCETYIVGAAISDDGTCITLEYHVSSGGHAEAFVREKGGVFKRLFESYDVDEWITSGKVAGLTRSYFPHYPHRSIHHSISLASSPNRFIFELGFGALRVSYSLDQQRITGWDRIVFAERSPARLALRELSGERGFTLVASGGDDRQAKSTTLVSFPSVPIDRSASEIRLRKVTSGGAAVELMAKVDEAQTAREDGIGEEEAVWKVELSGKGREFKALAARLSRMREEMASPTAKAAWPEVTTFSVIGEAPVGLSVARHPEKILETPPSEESNEPAKTAGELSGESAARALLLSKAKEAIEKGEYREAEKIFKEVLSKPVEKHRSRGGVHPKP